MERCQVSDLRFTTSLPMAFIHKFNWQTALRSSNKKASFSHPEAGLHQLMPGAG